MVFFMGPSHITSEISLELQSRFKISNWKSLKKPECAQYTNWTNQHQANTSKVEKQVGVFSSGS